jgi:hypothetical protein
MSNKSFQDEVWQTLSAINVNDHCAKKGNLTYLSWAWAWGTLMEYYPESTYEFRDTFIMANMTAEVWVSLRIKDGDREMVREMWLPVMDHRNKAITDPSTRDISDTRMRCLTKAMAMAGLGHYIYAGEDIPSAEKEPEPEKDPKVVEAFANTLTMAALQDLWNNTEHRGLYIAEKDEAKARLSA